MIKNCLILIPIFFGLITFQNCSDPVSLSEQDKASYSDDLPFAYSTKMDTFAYMSCADLTEPLFDRRAIFNFRIGAYEKNSGIQLTDEFKRRTQGFSAEAMKETLVRSPKSSGAILQFATRPSRGNLQQIFVNQENLVKEGEDITNFFGGAPLSAPKIAEKLVALETDESVNYISGIPGLEGRLMEASLAYHSRLRDTTNSFINDELVLMLTYTPEGDPRSYAARTPDPSRAESLVHGKKFVPQFMGVQRKHGAKESGGFRGKWQPGDSIIQNRTVRELRETDMLTNESTQWDCPADLRLIIANPFDARWTDSDPANDPCQRTADIATYDNPSALGTRDRKRLEIIRRILRVEDYYVNLQQNCVIPKDSKNSCYPKPTEDGEITVDINYGRSGSLQEECIDNPITSTYQCPHYVSICTRERLPDN